MTFKRIIREKVMKLYPIFLALIVSISAAHCQAQESAFSDTNGKEIDLGTALIAVASASYVGYQLFKFGYQKYQKYRILNAMAAHKKEDRIDTIVALIYTDLYPARLLNQLPVHEQKEVALAKSKLRARRTKMLDEIERRYGSSASAKYKITFQRWLDGVEKSFAAIDALPKNAFEAPFDFDAHYRKMDFWTGVYSWEYDNGDIQGLLIFVDNMVLSNKNVISDGISQKEALILEKLQMKDLDQASRDALPTIIFFYQNLPVSQLFTTTY